VVVYDDDDDDDASTPHSDSDEAGADHDESDRGDGDVAFRRSIITPAHGAGRRKPSHVPLLRPSSVGPGRCCSCTPHQRMSFHPRSRVQMRVDDEAATTCQTLVIGLPHHLPAPESADRSPPPTPRRGIHRVR
jgi:hypothetical protein